MHFLYLQHLTPETLLLLLITVLSKVEEVMVEKGVEVRELILLAAVVQEVMLFL
jgi:hypothetical protein